MGFVRIVQEREVLLLEIARGKANALNAGLVEELGRAVESSALDPRVRALVLASGVPRMFCAGFDVSEVFAYDRPRMLAFFSCFARLFERIRTLPKPVVCALEGHAFAGGAILALAADVRVMAATANLSVNEVNLAVTLPSRMIRALSARTGPEMARAMLLGAEVISAPRALASGLVSEVLPVEAVRAAALARAHSLGGKPAAAFAAHKRALDPLDAAAPLEAELDATMDAWFGAEARALRQALVEQLAKKSG